MTHSVATGWYRDLYCAISKIAGVHTCLLISAFCLAELCALWLVPLICVPRC